MSFSKIIITRPEPFASQLAEKLKVTGFADVVCLPCVEIEPAQQIPPLASRSRPPFSKGEQERNAAFASLFSNEEQERNAAFAPLFSNEEQERNAAFVSPFSKRTQESDFLSVPPLKKGVASSSERGDFSRCHQTLNDKLDILIFISRNAVIYGHQLITTEKIAAIGLGTKTELEQYQHSVDIFPQQAPFNSEALLALPEFSNVQHKKITIIRGGEGRDLLFDALSSRGAIVSYIDVYTRKQASYTDETLQQIFKDPDHSLVICTSEEILKNLCALLKKAKIDPSRLQLCVISAKMAEVARMAGFTKPAIIANSPKDEDIVWIIQSQKNQGASTD